jgi:hypothetical protein
LTVSSAPLGDAVEGIETMQRRTFLACGALVALGATRAVASPRSKSFTVDARVVLQSYQALVEQYLMDVLHAIRAIAATSDARSASWPAIKPALDRLGQDLSTSATVWLAQPDGSYASTEGVAAGATLADRDYFPELIAGRDVIARLVVSKSTGHRSIVVATPVEKGGRVVAAIGVSLRARLVSQVVADRMRLPQGMSFYALDSNGQAAIHMDPERMFQFPAELGEVTLKSAVATILSQPQGSVDYRFGGKSRTAIFEQSAITGWHFVLVRVHE